MDHMDREDHGLYMSQGRHTHTRFGAGEGRDGRQHKEQQGNKSRGLKGTKWLEASQRLASMYKQGHEEKDINKRWSHTPSYPACAFTCKPQRSAEACSQIKSMSNHRDQPQADQPKELAEGQTPL
eukprot:1148299-Pelagomonas_calceolata.AAC.3